MARSRSRRRSNFRPGLMLLALVIALFLWGVAQGSTDIRYSFDIPVEIHGVADTLVVTDQSAAEINVGVLGSRAALRNLEEDRMKYLIDVSSVKPGVAEFEIDLASIQLPRRARFNNHSPSRLQIRLERKTRKEVSVEADIQGDLIAGLALTEVRVVPDRVWLAGAKSHVMRVPSVKTTPIDLAEIKESQEVEARLVLLGGDTVWAEEDKPVTVQIVVEPVALPRPEPEPADAPVAGIPLAPANPPVSGSPPGSGDQIVPGGAPGVTLPEDVEVLDGVPPAPAEEEAMWMRDGGGRTTG